MLNHLLGGNLIKPPSGGKMTLEGQFITFNQVEFMNTKAMVPKDSSRAFNPFTVWADWLQASMSLFNPSSMIPSFDFSSLTLPGLSLPGMTLPGMGGSGASSGVSSFDKQGYVYFPRSCVKGKKCPIHVALHGCKQGKMIVYSYIFIIQI